MITITIKTDNEAFTDDPSVEIARILGRLAQEWYSVGNGTKLRDYNGNTVGTVRMTGKDRL